MEQNSIISFEQQNIRRVWHNEEWFFAVSDVVQALTDSTDVKQYIKKMRSRDPQLADNWGTICTLLALTATDGKTRKENTTNLQGIFRIVQSISSPKAEPFKMWLAKVGNERVQEIQNPELAADRVRELYKAKGYPDDWIEMRLRSIETRQQLTDEWQERGINESQEYGKLTAEISKGTFGITPSQHKEVKGLARQNLRDHMSPLELIFTMLGEETTKQVTVQDDAQGFGENLDAAQKGGNAAGKARQEYERQVGISVVSGTNFLHLEAEKKKKNLNDEHLK
jgi:prophage antirepressor-like protein